MLLKRTEEFKEDKAKVNEDLLHIQAHEGTCKSPDKFVMETLAKEINEFNDRNVQDENMTQVRRF